MKKFLLLVLTALTIVVVNATGQPTENWLFGSGATQKITSSGAAGTFGPTGTFTAGSASASDASGNLLFYTDGMTVYTAGGSVMTGGTGLFTNTTPYPSSPIIVPKPGSPCEYYIFSITDYADANSGDYTNSLVYATVRTSGTPEVTSKNNVINAVGVNSLQNKLAATSDGAGGYWIVAHGLNFITPTNAFYSYHITSIGVLYPIVSFIGSPAPNCDDTHTLVERNYAASGQACFSADGSMLGVTSMGCNQFELFSFNKATGQVKGFATNANQPVRVTEADMTTSAPYGGFGGSACYGIQFSPNNSRVYVTTSGILSSWYNYLFQYSIGTLNNAAVLSSVCSVYSNNIGASSLGMMRLGPDNKIYVAKPSTPYLAVISDPNQKQDCISSATTCGFLDNSVYLSGYSYGVSLPSTVSGFKSLYNINSKNRTSFCTGQGMTLSIYEMPEVLPDGTSITWQRPNGAQSYDISLSVPDLTLDDAGTYTVTITNGCGTYTMTVTITVDNCLPPPSPCASLQAAFYGTGSNPIQFTNATVSVSPLTYYHWDFGDGTTSNEANPVHQYNAVQDYVVCLTVSIIDSNGCCSDSVCQLFCCVPPSDFECEPENTATFDYLVSSGTPGLVDFTSTNTVTSSIEPEYLWDFGDGSSAVQPDPSNIYALSGTYTVCLKLLNPLTKEVCNTYCTDVTVDAGLNMLNQMAYINPNFMMVSPNPTVEYVDVNYKNVCSPTARLMIYNTFGQELYNTPLNTDVTTVRVNVKEWSSGLYTVKLLSEGQVLEAQKFNKVQD